MWNDERDQKRPDYQNYYPYQNYYDYNGKPKKKKHTGLLVVLVVLALISGAASWAVNVLGLRVDVGQKSLSIGIDDPAVAEETEELGHGGAGAAQLAAKCGKPPRGGFRGLEPAGHL